MQMCQKDVDHYSTRETTTGKDENQLTQICIINILWQEHGFLYLKFVTAFVDQSSAPTELLVPRRIFFCCTLINGTHSAASDRKCMSLMSWKLCDHGLFKPFWAVSVFLVFLPLLSCFQWFMLSAWAMTYIFRFHISVTETDIWFCCHKKFWGFYLKKLYIHGYHDASNRFVIQILACRILLQVLATSASGCAT